MENNKPEGFNGVGAEDFFAIGRGLGFAAAALIAGYFQGQKEYDAFAERTAARAMQPPESPEGDACEQCWCYTCLNRDICDAFGTADDMRPSPCAECNDKDEAPLMPRALNAECGTYAEELETCKACWCRVCAEFERCVIDAPDYPLESKPCPCDVCRDDAQYMPKQEPPTCGKFVPLKKAE